MTRLQKKCFIAVAGTHLLLVVALLCSGFITSKPKPDDSQVLDVIPTKLIDEAFNSGVKNAKPPPPAPIVQPQPLPPEPPKPEVKPEPVKPVEPVTPPEKIQPEDLKPVDRTEPKTKPLKHEIKPDMQPVVRQTTKTTDNAQAEKVAREQKRLRDTQLKMIREAARDIRKNTSSSTEITIPGNNSEAYANYDQAVLSIYNQAWVSPEGMKSNEAIVKVKIIVSRDGTVISASIVERSGDSRVDASVQRALDRVSKLLPFPEGATESQRTIEFNFKTKAKPLFG